MMAMHLKGDNGLVLVHNGFQGVDATACFYHLLLQNIVIAGPETRLLHHHKCFKICSLKPSITDKAKGATK